MLKNRAFAWILTMVVMVLAVFVGVYTTYSSMRNTAVRAFESEVIPTIHQTMMPAFDMHVVAQHYLSPSELAAIGIERIVEDIQSTSNPNRIYQYFVLLNRGVYAIYDRLAEMDVSDRNQDFINRFLGDFEMLDLIISQAGYNNTAEEFNNALGRNLGFIVRLFIGEMPRFDQ